MVNILHPLLRIWEHVRWRFFDTFGTRCYEQVYRGHGDYEEIPGWLFRGKFYKRD